MLKSVTQFSVFLINKPGILSQVCDELASSKINVVALTLMDSVEHGVFRFVAEDADRTRTALKSLSVPMTETEVLSVQMPNRPGAVADLCAGEAEDRARDVDAVEAAETERGHLLGSARIHAHVVDREGRQVDAVSPGAPLREDLRVDVEAEPPARELRVQCVRREDVAVRGGVLAGGVEHHLARLVEEGREVRGRLGSERGAGVLDEGAPRLRDL